MGQLLKKGSWKEFKKWSQDGYNLPYDVRKFIHTYLYLEEIKRNYLSGFPILSTNEKLKLTLNDIINPIRVGEKKAYKGGVHPGRLTLNPDAYHDNLMGRKRRIRCCGGHPTRLRRCGIGKPCEWKHRLLDYPEYKQHPSFCWRHGLQQIYFMCGLPLIFWSYNHSMGLKWYDQRFVLRPEGATPYPMNSLQWKTNKDLDEYNLPWWINDEMTYLSTIGVLDRRTLIRRFRHEPRTRWSSEEYCMRHSGGKATFDPQKDGANDMYVVYLQHFEDMYTAFPNGQHESDDNMTPRRW